VAFSQENVGGIVKSENPHKTIPQSASLTAPFTQGSLPPQKHSALIFICILFFGRAFFEPRDYRVVFVLQKSSRAFARELSF